MSVDLLTKGHVRSSSTSESNATSNPKKTTTHLYYIIFLYIIFSILCYSILYIFNYICLIHAIKLWNVYSLRICFNIKNQIMCINTTRCRNIIRYFGSPCIIYYSNCFILYLTLHHLILNNITSVLLYNYIYWK